MPVAGIMLAPNEGEFSDEAHPVCSTYEPNSYQLTMNVASTGASPMENVNMKMRVDAKRIGECSAKAG